jgi:hypothetical protein
VERSAAIAAANGWVGAVLYEQLGHRLAAGSDSAQERRLAIPALLVWAGALVEQELRNRALTVLAREHQRRCPVPICCVYIGITALEQRGRNIKVSSAAGPVQSRPPVGVRRGCRRTVVEGCIDSIEPTGNDSFAERLVQFYCVGYFF